MRGRFGSCVDKLVRAHPVTEEREPVVGYVAREGVHLVAGTKALVGMTFGRQEEAGFVVSTFQMGEQTFGASIHADAMAHCSAFVGVVLCRFEDSDRRANVREGWERHGRDPDFARSVVCAVDQPVGRRGMIVQIGHELPDSLEGGGRNTASTGEAVE